MLKISTHKKQYPTMKYFATKFAIFPTDILTGSGQMYATVQATFLFQQKMEWIRGSRQNRL